MFVTLTRFPATSGFYLREEAMPFAARDTVAPKVRALKVDSLSADRLLPPRTAAPTFLKAFRE